MKISLNFKHTWPTLQLFDSITFLSHHEILSALELF